MPRIAVAVQVAYRHRLDPLPFEHRERWLERLRIERRLDPAVGAQPLANPEPQLARNQLLGRRQPQIVTVVLEPFAHLDDVASVVSSPTFAPLYSMSALVATVVP